MCQHWFNFFFQTYLQWSAFKQNMHLKFFPNHFWTIHSIIYWLISNILNPSREVKESAKNININYQQLKPGCFFSFVMVYKNVTNTQGVTEVARIKHCNLKIKKKIHSSKLNVFPPSGFVVVVLWQGWGFRPSGKYKVLHNSIFF